MAAELKVVVDIQGMEEILRVLKRLEKANFDLRGPMGAIGIHMLKSFNDNFMAQGIPELGIRWTGLSQWTLRGRKKRTTRGRRKRNRGKFGDKILMDTGIMRMSTTSKSHPNNVFDIDNTSVEAGTNINYALTHQPRSGSPHVNPERRIPGVRVREHKRKLRGGKKIRVREFTREQFMPRTTVPVRPFVTIKPSDVEVILRILEQYEKSVVESA